MRHLGTKVIETGRLVLRPFTLEDAPAMYENWASDDDVTKFLTWPTHGSQEISKMVLEDWISHYGEATFYQWAIVVKGEKDDPIGSISVVEMDDMVGKVQIGYCIGKNWWRQGITSEALKGVMDFLFDQVGAQRVEAKHDANNPNSGRVMKKCGMKYEGTIRSSERNNQGICDSCWYGILAEER